MSMIGTYADIESLAEIAQLCAADIVASYELADRVLATGEAKTP